MTKKKLLKKILRLPEVIKLTGLCRTSIYEQMNKNTFPNSIALNDDGRAVGWILADIEKWIDSRIKESKKMKR